MRLVLLLAATLAMPSVADAGPWTKRAGEHYVKIDADVYVTSDYEDARTGPDGEGAAFERFVGQQYSIYGELGVFPPWPVHVGVAIEARFAGDVVTKNAPRGVSFGGGVSWRWPNPATQPRSE